jgi:hypothetical protein
MLSTSSSPAIGHVSDASSPMVPLLGGSRERRATHRGGGAALTPLTPQMEKPRGCGAFAIAGAGFEPATPGVMSRPRLCTRMPPYSVEMQAPSQVRSKPFAFRRHTVTSLRKHDACRRLQSGRLCSARLHPDHRPRRRSSSACRNAPARAAISPRRELLTPSRAPGDPRAQLRAMHRGSRQRGRSRPRRSSAAVPSGSSSRSCRRGRCS